MTSNASYYETNCPAGHAVTKGLLVRGNLKTALYITFCSMPFCNVLELSAITANEIFNVSTASLIFWYTFSEDADIKEKQYISLSLSLSLF